jgi:hypothetical protein
MSLSPENLKEQAEQYNISVAEYIDGAIQKTALYMTGMPLPHGEYPALDDYGETNCWYVKFLLQHIVNEHYRYPHLRRNNSAEAVIVTDTLRNLDDLPRPSRHFEKKLKVLGGHILSTAYRCLGDGIDQRIQEITARLHNNQGDEVDKILLINKFLNTEIDNFLNRSKSEQDSGSNELGGVHRELFQNTRAEFHMLGLSPEILSVSIDYGNKPTCLAVSIISASLLRQLGVEDVLYCGVPRTRDYIPAATACTLALDSQNAIPENAGHDYFMSRLKEVAVTSRQTLFDYDPHASVGYRIGAVWVLYDYYTKTIFDTFDRDSDQELLDFISKNVDVFPSTVAMIEPDTKQFLSAVSLLVKRSAQTLVDRYPSRDRLRNALHYAILNASMEPIIEVVESSLGTSIFDLLRNTNLFEHRITHMLQSTDHPELCNEDQIAREIIARFINSALRDQVFQEASRSASWHIVALGRAQRDEVYFERVLDCLEAWPHFLLLRAVQTARNDISFKPNFNIPHNFVEVGNIDHSIGLFSLLDVCKGLGMHIPLSWWTAQSSSQLPWYDEVLSEIPFETNSIDYSIEKSVRERVMWDDSYYAVISGIVLKRLEAGGAYAETEETQS